MEFLCSEEDIVNWLASKLEEYAVYIPSEYGFERASSSDELKLNFPLPAISIKSLFFPHSDVLMRFRGKEIVEALPDEEKKIVLTKACDANSLKVLDAVFLSEPVDPYYERRRKNTVIVTVECEQMCYGGFCKDIGIEPEGDVVIRRRGKSYCVEVRNSELLPEFEKFEACDEGAEETAKGTKENLLNIEWLEDAFESEVWDEVSRFCISCGVCTYLCPTCHCFDITDSGRVRIRTWDSCQFPYFTMHTSGYNPRPEKKHRLRNRIYHKFSYFPQRYGIVACVGCGRCVRMCPSRIDIRELVLRRD